LCTETLDKTTVCTLISDRTTSSNLTLEQHCVLKL